jgi:transposase
MRRKAYRSTEVKHVELELVVARGPQGALTVGLDVGKFVIYVVVRWSDGSFERPWTVENPSEIELLVRLLVALAASRKMTVAMESTGTYGDALRGKLSAAGLLLHRVGGKAASDYAEIFDGVPSQHDGKDAAVVAELAAIGKSRAWPLAQPSDADGAMKIELLVGSAAGTVGLRQGPRDQERMRQNAGLALAAFRECQQAREELAKLALENEVIQRQAQAVGEATACVLWVALGDPRSYASGAAYRKAMGLNLKERSSGRYQGQLKISKRGPSIARRWMYFAAMRTVQDDGRAWYEAKKAKDNGCGMGALIAVMRKLALAAYGWGRVARRLIRHGCFPANHGARERRVRHEEKRSKAILQIGGFAPKPPRVARGLGNLTGLRSATALPPLPLARRPTRGTQCHPTTLGNIPSGPPDPANVEWDLLPTL